MRIDRGVGKGSIGDSPGPGKETSITKKGAKVKLAAGEDDKIRISQNQNSLAIQINDLPPHLLSSEESKNLEIVSGEGKVVIDADVTIPIRGVPRKVDPIAGQKVDPANAAAHKKDTELTASLKRNSLISELPEGWQGLAPNKPAELSAKPAGSGNQENVATNQSNADASVPVKTGTVNANNSFTDLKTGTIADNEPIKQNERTGEVLIPEPESVQMDRQGQPLDDLRVVHDLEKLGSMTPEQKSSLIDQILGRPVITNSNEAIQSILFSAKNPEEFNKIVDAAGGKKLQVAFQGSDVEVFWNRLVGLNARPDLAIDPGEASITNVLFEKSELQEKLLPLRAQPLLLQTDLMQTPINLDELNHRDSVFALLENISRKPDEMIVPGDLREKVFDLLQDRTIPEEERPLILQELGREAGLTEFQMREIVSLPMMAAFQTAIVGLMDLRSSKLESFEVLTQQAIATYGPESVAVEIARAEQDEFLGNLDPQIALFQKLKTAASELFSGPGNPVVQADVVVHAFLNEVIPPVRQISTSIEALAKGSQLFATDKIQNALYKMEEFKLPELRGFTSQGITFLNNLSTFTRMTSEIADRQIRPFLFFDRLRDGTFHQQVSDFGRSFREFSNSMPVGSAMKRLEDWRELYRSSNRTMDQQKLLQTSQELIASFAQELTVRASGLNRTIADIRLQEKLSGLIDSVQMGGDLIVSFRNGHFVQVLAALNQRMAGSPAVLQIIQQALHLTTTGANFFHALFSREWERPLTQTMKKNPANRDLAEIHTIFSDTLNLFLPLSDIDHLTPFLQYQKQLGFLRDESLIQDAVHRYQSDIPKS